MISNKNKVSIIVPCYNCEKYISECLESIINQSYNNLEIILINDGSTDNTESVISKYDDSRIVYKYQENGGVSVARNAGLSLVTGDYIMFLDSDDKMKNDAVEIALESILNTDSDIVTFNYIRSCKDEDKILIEEKDEIKTYTGKDICNEYFKDNDDLTFILWRKIYKKEIFDNIKFPDGLVPEDMAIGLETLLQCKKISHIYKNLVYYRVLSDSLTTVRNLKKTAFMLDIMKKNYVLSKNFILDSKDINSKYVRNLIFLYFEFSSFGAEADQYARDIKEELYNMLSCNNYFKIKIILLCFFICKPVLKLIINKKVQVKNSDRD